MLRTSRSRLPISRANLVAALVKLPRSSTAFPILRSTPRTSRLRWMPSLPQLRVLLSRSAIFKEKLRQSKAASPLSRPSRPLSSTQSILFRSKSTPSKVLSALTLVRPRSSNLDLTESRPTSVLLMLASLNSSQAPPLLRRRSLTLMYASVHWRRKSTTRWSSTAPPKTSPCADQGARIAARVTTRSTPSSPSTSASTGLSTCMVMLALPAMLPGA